MTKTASDLLMLFTQLPESEQALMLERLTASASEFDAQKFTEVYKGVEIEVYRSQRNEKIHGRECWISTYTNIDGERKNEITFYESAQECLEATRFLITWEIEQKDMSDQFEKLIQQFESKGYTQAGIMSGLYDALDRSNWNSAALNTLDEVVKILQMPDRILP